MRLLPVASFAAVLLFGQVFADSTVDFPKVNLRGYGTVGGTLTVTEGKDQSGSVLAVECGNEEKAGLLQAKFLSDEQLLPGVDKISIDAKQWGVGSLRFGGVPVTAYQVKGQGFLAAIRQGTKVFLVASPTQDELVVLVDKSVAGSKDTIVSESATPVPMWLDRFDKHGFRFYYSTGYMPEKATAETYDFRGDFTFAKKHDVGMVFWNTLSAIMGADGQTDDAHWDWAEGLARLNNLPTAINLSASNFSLPTWVANRYREDGLMQPMPGYLGDSMSVASWRSNESKAGELAWGVTPARDAMLRALQSSVRHFNDHSNVVSWMEPLNELSQGGDDYMGYGPGADTTYHQYLQEKYGSVDKLSQAWFGQADKLKSWEDVHAPELASFLGWGPDALDLGGSWRVANTDAAPPAEWSSSTFDDSSWQTVTAPGDDRNFYLPKKPAVYRRNFDLPADWSAKNPRSWIYLWDLNRAYDEKLPPVSIFVNGQKIGESHCKDPISHWMAAEATSALKAGPDQLSVTLPSGYLGYRIYLSPTEPKQYPHLGEGMNAQWADLVDWRQKSRIDSLRRGMEMIREVDPNRYITLASPYYSLDGIKGAAEDYGGEFHDTGGMSGNWSDQLTSVMRGSDLPCSLEPGNGAHNVEEFKTTLGLWSTEGLQQIDYFQHIGEIMWFPDLTKCFEENLPALHLFGKYHIAKSDLAFFFCTGTDALTGYPWLNDPNANLQSGFVCKGVPDGLLSFCPRDYITESDFPRGNAAPYKVVFDTNTSIMDEKLLGQIEKYVRDGGIFVTFGQTGRHTPTKPDSWPIEKLTGYHVLTIEKFDAKGNSTYDEKETVPTSSRGQHLHPAPGQQIYPTQESWMNTPYITGLRMQKAANDVQDLIMWEDGTVAIGMRKLGKGTIIEFGAKNNGQPYIGISEEAVLPLLRWAGVKMNTVDSALDDPAAQNLQKYFFREYVSNNGLYNISALWNPSRTDPIKATLTFNDNPPATARDVNTGQEIALQNGKLTGLPLEPLQTRFLVTPRNVIAKAPADWFTLQRQWWKAALPVTKPFPQPDNRFVQDFSENWSWHPMGDKDDPQPWTASGFDDSSWPKLRLGVWNTVPERETIKHGFLRRSFTVAKEWTSGRVELWIQTAGTSFLDKGRVWLDGKPLSSWFGESGISGADLTTTLTPGSMHTLSAEVMSTGEMTGMVANVWIKYIPKPQGTIDLAGTWTLCNDDLFHDTGTVTLPGDYVGKSLWRTIPVPKEDEGKTVILTTESERPFHAFINGAMIRYSSGNIPSQHAHVEIDITPWIHCGQENRIHLISTYEKGTVTRAALDFYDKGNYP